MEDALSGFDDDVGFLSSAERSDVDAKVRQSVETSIEVGDEEGPARAVRRAVGFDETAAARSGRATAVRSKDMIECAAMCKPPCI